MGQEGSRSVWATSPVVCPRLLTCSRGMGECKKWGGKGEDPQPHRSRDVREGRVVSAEAAASIKCLESDPTGEDRGKHQSYRKVELWLGLTAGWFQPPRGSPEPQVDWSIQAQHLDSLAKALGMTTSPLRIPAFCFKLKHLKSSLSVTVCLPNRQNPHFQRTDLFPDTVPGVSRLPLHTLALTQPSS